ncbi:hypothetical protein J5N97_015945 [Dioscorea zingiberensis]|uniref:Band 7 domain-containing protein n=1 Tax=Dioscorea zingiberensis TaxID=325984 RepID=A0A9D5HEY2_9LILI|nr:hypothetical protein J5N97_015945 [Dioscorea zingiberensis]
MNPQPERPQFNPVRPPAARAEAADDEYLVFLLTAICIFAIMIAVWSILVVVALPADYVKVSQVLLLEISMTNGSFSILHQVPEGHVGVYWRGGALLDTITDPGFHLKLPVITHFEPIQVTLQTDEVKDIPCGTKGGVMISFDKIEIDEKMKEAIQIDCTLYAPGIEIISVRVTKPNIPSSIKRNFELMEEERTKALIAIERQKVAEKEAETQKKVALTEAEKNAQVSKILMEQKLLEKNSAKRQEEIENEIFISREKSLADASFYRLMKEAEANKQKLTPEFLELKFIKPLPTIQRTTLETR